MESWESGVTRDDAGNWVIVPNDGSAIVKFIKSQYQELANIVGGEAVKFTRNPNNPDWAAKIALDTGLDPLTSAANDGAALTPAARTRLDSALAERLFWASFLPAAERAGVTEDMRERLQALKGPVKKQTLIDKGF